MPRHPSPPGRPPTDPQTNRLVGAAFCMVCFAVLIWPLGRMWQERPLDLEKLIPVGGLMVFMVVLAVAQIVMFSRASYDRSARKARKTADVLIEVALHPQVELTPHSEPVVLAAASDPDPDPDPEPIETLVPFVYPEPADTLPAAFRAMVRMIREYADDPAAVAQMERVYAIAKVRPRFLEAEDFVLRKAERQPGWNADAYADPIDPGNPALFYDEADAVHPLAGTVLAMVLIADQLPVETWDRIAAPWDGARLEFPEVVLAG